MKTSEIVSEYNRLQEKKDKARKTFKSVLILMSGLIYLAAGVATVVIAGMFLFAFMKVGYKDVGFLMTLPSIISGLASIFLYIELAGISEKVLK